jgi:hypothetical protein
LTLPISMRYRHMAGPEPIVYICGKRFKDVTNHTSSSPIMNYEEARAYACKGRYISTNSNRKKRG